MSKGSGATSENCLCGPRIAGLLSFASIGVVVVYHGSMAYLLKRVGIYSEALEVCKTNFESLGLNYTAKEQKDLFGEIFVFMTFEAFIFFA